MGYITNQWLKGFTQRHRHHNPVKVSVRSSMSMGRWERLNGIGCRIYASKQSGDYQYIEMTQNELDHTVKKLIAGTSGQARASIAKSIMTDLDDSDLLALLGSVIDKR